MLSSAKIRMVMIVRTMVVLMHMVACGILMRMGVFMFMLVDMGVFMAVLVPVVLMFVFMGMRMLVRVKMFMVFGFCHGVLPFDHKMSLFDGRSTGMMQEYCAMLRIPPLLMLEMNATGSGMNPSLINGLKIMYFTFSLQIWLPDKFFQTHPPVEQNRYDLLLRPPLRSYSIRCLQYMWLDIQNRCAVKHVNASDMNHRAIDIQNTHNGKPDGVGTSG